jgi:hypothetical protein
VTCASGFRRGAKLTTNPALHVTNGDSVVETLRETSLGGEIIAWQDVLHEGPLSDDPRESRELRSHFLSEHGWGEREAIHAKLEERDRTLAAAAHVVLWFEHDLYDQLQLLQILSQVGVDQDVQLVQAASYLGSLDAGELEVLWDTRHDVGAETRALGREAWRAVCANEIEAFVSTHDTDALPFLATALRRLQQERAPLPRTKRQLLAALAAGAKTPLEAYAANQSSEEAIFLGDTWAFLKLHELARDGLVTPLPEPPPHGDYRAFVDTPVAVTEDGRRLL